MFGTDNLNWYLKHKKKVFKQTNMTVQFKEIIN